MLIKEIFLRFTFILSCLANNVDNAKIALFGGFFIVVALSVALVLIS
jgi:hypothetical protein